MKVKSRVSMDDIFGLTLHAGKRNVKMNQTDPA